MTAQLLATELTNLIQESKRKHNDLRQAAEKSLEELKSLNVTSEAQLGPELTQHTNFVNPFIIACGTKNAKFTGIAIVCLQRLIVSKALPRPRLNQVLEALQGATSAGLDVQLKILQALPSLLQNYSADVKGDLLVTALNICFILQSSKNAIVNNTSAATLQQLVVSVFDKVVSEDRGPSDAAFVGEAPGEDGVVKLKSAATDAYRVFNDLCLLTENQRPEYLRFSGLPQTFGLELIESVLTNHAAIFSAHPEQAHILRTRVLPFIISALSGKPNFATTVRLLRILYTLLRRHLTLLPSESGDAMDILTRLLDQDSAVWKRSLCMEVFRGIFAEPGLLRRVFALFDAQEGQKDILKNLTATFVKISTEKPAVIGLGQQSTIPVANPYASIGASTDHAMLEAAGVPGMIGSSVGSDGHNTGISTQWSSIRVPCIDQLDKTEPPSIPESYIYSLTLACITSLSEGLAKFILPLTVSGDRGRKRSGKQEVGRPESPVPTSDEASTPPTTKTGLERTPSFKRNPVPVNPLLLEDHPLHTDIRICAGIIDECWPAILATCSTFLYAALDSDYYHGLVRAFQKFAHVAGLLQLATPRDAFLTTLGKAAVPPHVLTACLSSGARPSTPTGSSSATAPDTPSSILSNARGMLSVDSLVSQASSAGDRPRGGSVDHHSSGPSTLNTRNMLCLRALLNLGIALGPTLESSWRIILETLQQADFVLFATSKAAGRVPTVTRTPDQQADSEASQLLGNFNTEVKAVETAASRLFESTIDFPNGAFVEVVNAVCNLLEHPVTSSESSTRPQSPTPSGGGGTLKAPAHSHKRAMSTSLTSVAGANQEDQFALAKLGDLATINLERLLGYPPDVSGWTPLVSELISTSGSATANPPVRIRAVEILVRIILESATTIAATPKDVRTPVQIRLLEAFRDALLPLQMPSREGALASVATHATDVEIHKAILEGLKSILESCGESLLSGWDIAFEIIDSIFLTRRGFSSTRAAVGGGGDAAAATATTAPPTEVLTTRSPRLIRSSFGSLQLICSDFVASLPNSCFLLLVDTLYKFCSQGDDLNVALTTVTFFWAISDFLSGKSRTLAITEEMVQGPSDTALVELASDEKHPGAAGALGMLLLLRLTSVTTDQRLELRNSAIQTLLRIIHAYGNSLTPEAWNICIKSVIFRLLSFIEARLGTAHDASAKGAPVKTDWDETAVVIINSVSDLLSNYLDVLLTHNAFSLLWSELLRHLATMLDFKVLDINSATFSSLGSILAKCEEGGTSGRKLDTSTINLAWDLWARGLPIPDAEDAAAAALDPKSEDNQKCLLSWVEALLAIYRLIRQDLDLDRLRRMLSLLRDAMVRATPGSYASDVEYVTPLQGKIVEVCRIVRTDIQGAPSAMICQVAEFVTFAFAPDMIQNGNSSANVTTTAAATLTPAAAAGQRKRTYVAMSKESMRILHHHVTRNASDHDVFSSGAFHIALSALARPIVLKYRFPLVTKSTQPWREATSATLAILESTLPHLRAADMPRPVFQEIWQVIVEIATGIVSADYSSPSASPAATAADIPVDQEFDIESFHKLRELVIPALGAPEVLEKTRRAYAEALFRMSIVHEPTPVEAAIIYGATGRSSGSSSTGGMITNGGSSSGDVVSKGMANFFKPRNGRTVDPVPTRRERMSYVCLDELFSLVSAPDDDVAAAPTIIVQPPTPLFPRKPPPTPQPQSPLAASASTETLRPQRQQQSPSSSSRRKMHIALASTAAPYLILRCALVLRAYIADQPLRGRMPQPLAQRQEVTRVLEGLVALRSETEAIPDLEGVDCEGRKHLLRLYPLLVGVARTAGEAGDARTAGVVGEGLRGVGAELGVL